MSKRFGKGRVPGCDCEKNYTCRKCMAERKPYFFTTSDTNIKLKRKRMENGLMKTDWTIEKVKKELPTINVKLPDDRIVTGYVKGRCLDFARVHTNVTGYSEPVQVSWNTIANCLNNNRPIIY